MAQSANRVEMFLPDESASIEFAGKLARAVQAVLAGKQERGLIIYLRGDLGAGKSFVSRALIQTYAPEQKVKSPTYTLVETYSVELDDKPLQIHHFDLYRLCDPEELEYLAIRDLFQDNFLALIEWPQKGQPLLPAADMEIYLQHQESGRTLELQAFTEIGREVVENF